MNQAAEKRRLAAKRGWHDGHNNEDRNPPTKLVGKPLKGGNIGISEIPASASEIAAYHKGFSEGRNALPGSTNPYGAYAKTNP